MTDVRFASGPVRVRVPATSANLGPGFDALGLALGLYDEIGVRIVASGLTVTIVGEGAEGVRRDERNLVVRAMREAFDELGGQPTGLEIVCTNRIPHSRGLGSSAAAIVGGIAAARALGEDGMTDDQLLRLATCIEGHPDNVAACLYGGATVAWMGRDGVRAERLDVDSTIRPVAFIPDASRQSTKEARHALPQTVSHADAARTAGRAALLVRALGAQPGLLLAATEDWLHQPYRLGNQPGGAAIVQRLREAGIPTVLSGSGPSVLSLASSEEQCALAVSLAGSGFTAKPLAVDREGVVELPVS